MDHIPAGRSLNKLAGLSSTSQSSAATYRPRCSSARIANSWLQLLWHADCRHALRPSSFAAMAPAEVGLNQLGKWAHD